MDENKKTITFVGSAAVICLLAWLSLPRPPSPDLTNEEGQNLFASFKDPLNARRMEIVKYDEETATLERFEVAQRNGVWSIPSKQDYPADAERQMANAASGLIDLTVLRVESKDRSTHELYGVKDPQNPELRVGEEGVGMRVVMRDADDKVLGEIIVGKEVKDQTGQRYVRHGGAGRDHVYVVKIDPSRYSTKFADWIEKDLLQLNSFDVREVNIDDYTIEAQFQLSGQILLNPIPRAKIGLSYDDTNSQWSITDMQEYQDQAWKETALADNEELNTQKLNDLRNALDDLRIVDVQRKPEGVGRDLRADAELAQSPEAMRSLVTRGFYALPPAEGEERGSVLSSEGEIICKTKDGIEYILRFGEIAGKGEDDGSTTEDAGEESESATTEEDQDSGPGLNRYLLVMARFDESMIPAPELEPLPPENATGQAEEEEAPAEDSGSETENTETDSAAPEETDTETAPQDSDEAPKQEEVPATDETPGEETPNEEASTEQAENAEESTEDDASSTTEKTGDETTGELSEEEDEAAKERQRIEQANQRKLDEYNEKVESTKKKVAELNDRFADWYYVISEDVYRKIHLGRADVVKEKEPEESDDGDSGAATGGLGEFESLSQGLDN